jgi:cell division protein FtsB
MKVLMQELNDILAEKNSRIAILEWENQQLKKENAELKNDIEKLKENEVKMYE